jgi:hypothetical protein
MRQVLPGIAAIPRFSTKIVSGRSLRNLTARVNLQSL